MIFRRLKQGDESDSETFRAPISGRKTFDVIAQRLHQFRRRFAREKGSRESLCQRLRGRIREGPNPIGGYDKILRSGSSRFRERRGFVGIQHFLAQRREQLLRPASMN